MVFSVNGLKTTDNKPITMDLGTGHTDPATNITMLTHIPLPTFEYGSANPRVGMGCLTERVTVLTYCIAKTGDQIVSAETKALGTVLANWNAKVIVRKTILTMSSAILAAPGADTGELLVGMPHTGVSTSQTDETMKMQLRVYLGAVLKRPESAIILPHIMCDSLVAETKVANVIKNDYAEVDINRGFRDWVADEAKLHPVSWTGAAPDVGQPLVIGKHVIYPCSLKAAVDGTVIANTGPLGKMDDCNHPEMAALMHGDLSSMMTSAVRGYKAKAGG